jgi:hypothetical protein
MKKIDKIVETLYEQRHERELDTVLPVLGDEGMGKSTLMMQIGARYLQIRDGEPPSADQLLDRICYNRRDFSEMMANSEKQALIMAPDAARILYSMDVAKSEQKQIEKSLMDVRGLEYMILLGFQSWRRIGGEIKERRAKLTFYIPRRGLVRAYGRKAMDEKLDSGEWPSATVSDYFPPLDGTAFWNRYQKVDQEKKRERLAAEEEKAPEDVEKDVKRAVVLRATKPWAPDHIGMTQRDAAELVDYSDSWVSDTVRDWKKGEYRDLVEAKEGVIA